MLYRNIVHARYSLIVTVQSSKCKSISTYISQIVIFQRQNNVFQIAIILLQSLMSKSLDQQSNPKQQSSFNHLHQTSWFNVQFICSICVSMFGSRLFVHNCPQSKLFIILIIVISYLHMYVFTFNFISETNDTIQVTVTVLASQSFFILFHSCHQLSSFVLLGTKVISVVSLLILFVRVRVLWNVHVAPL